MRIKACEEAGTCGARASAIIELCESQSASGKGVDVGCGNLAAIAADIGIAHIVGHDEEDVRTLVGFLY